MGNTTYTSKPPSYITHSKNKWEINLFGRFNVTESTSWRSFGIDPHAKINITEYAWFSLHSPNKGLWKPLGRMHSWAAQLVKKMEQHDEAKTVPLSQSRISSLQSKNKSFSTWAYARTEQAILPGIGGGFDIIMKNFFGDLLFNRNVSKYFATEQPIIYSSISQVNSAKQAADTLSVLYGDNFQVMDVSSSSWTLMNMGGESLWTKSIPLRIIVNTNNTAQVNNIKQMGINNNESVSEVILYQLTTMEVMQGVGKITMLVVESSDVPQSQMQSRLQSVVGSTGLDDNIPVEGKQYPLQLLSATPAQKNQIHTSSANWSDPYPSNGANMYGASGADALAESYRMGITDTVEVNNIQILNKALFVIHNRSLKYLTYFSQDKKLMLDGPIQIAVSILWYQKTYFQIGPNKLFLKRGGGDALTTTTNTSDALRVNMVWFNGVLSIIDPETSTMLSSVILKWVSTSENKMFHGWFKTKPL